ncbi:hypothetical protein [Actinoplanes rectilineatus]|uniref:hypothetical protein n=1 Tax=Actinoplanes rectilineatus TaxID=113571 RepID=UPI0005F28181|nr:hypothetical protein [Actinoplanes rectilineatus]
MVARRSVLMMLLAGGTLMIDRSGSPEIPIRIDADAVDLLRRRTRSLRDESTEVVEPLVDRLESHAGLLSGLLGGTPRTFRVPIGQMASETAWLAANAHADNGDDRQSLEWGKRAARLAREVNDQDLRAHALTRISRTHLSLKDPAAALEALERIDARRLSPYGRARLEVHRALAYSRQETAAGPVRASSAFRALDIARESLMAAGSHSPRPEWVWWNDDEGFVKSWESEALRSLELPRLAVPAFQQAIVAAGQEDIRELPFLRGGLAEALAHGGDLDAAAEEAVRAVLLARAVDADAALGRVRALHRTLNLRAPHSRHVQSLREALRS